MTDPRDDLQTTFALLKQLPEASREAMVRMYLQALKEHITRIGEGMEPGADALSVMALVHRIAGSSGMMQDLALCEVARAMELALREGRIEDARAHWPQMQRRAQATLAALEGAYPGLA